MSRADPGALLAELTEQLAGSYAIEREVGRGAMARVYQATDLKRGGAVAVKLLPPDLASSSNAERFLREISITAGLDHPNILPLLDSGVSAGLYWYVMPFLEGESLRDRLKRVGGLPLDEALDTGRQILSALAHAHARGVVHRDVKPENVMRSSDRWVVTDFGLARAIGGEVGLTGMGMPLGTPAYMSPEQITGAATVDARADIYGFACVLYELLAGRPPFIGTSVVQLLQAHMSQSPRSLTELRPEVPAWLDRTVRKALAKDADGRHPTADALLAELSAGGASVADGDGGAASGGLLSRLFGRKSGSSESPR